MNTVVLIGRLTRDVEVKYTEGREPVAVLRNSIAIDRPKREGAEKQTDFISVVIFGKQAENCEKYLAKGSKVAVQGRIQTGSYTNKEGATVYTTDVVAERVEFVEFKGQNQEPTQQSFQQDEQQSFEPTPPGFSVDDSDVPF